MSGYKYIQPPTRGEKIQIGEDGLPLTPDNPIPEGDDEAAPQFPKTDTIAARAKATCARKCR